MTQHPYPPQPPYWQPQPTQPPRRGWRTWSKKRKVWTGVAVAFAAVSVLAHAANVKNAHPAATAAAKPVTATHSTAAPRATPSTKPTSKPKVAVKPTVDPAALHKLSRDGDDHGAYCTVFYDANHDGTLHLAAILGEKATTGTVAVDAQATASGDWSDSYELVSAKAQNDSMNVGMSLTHRWNAPMRLSDVREITAELSPDDDSSTKLYNCEITPTGGLS
jgi:hypothetical protein